VAESKVELTTFRSESGYSDGRRPDFVQWGTSVEEDALRRDFTCNALYLDPADGEFLDPTEGWNDLEAGRLVTVGDAEARFREDGLRLLRMARLSAGLDLEPTPEVLLGARAAGEALRGISPERVAQEFRRLFDGPAPRRGFEMLTDLDLLKRALPGWSDEGAALRWDALDALIQPPGEALGYAVLLEPSPTSAAGSDEPEVGVGLLKGLRPSRILARSVSALWSNRVRLEECVGQPLRRCQRLRLFRDEHWEDAGRLTLAWRRAQGREERPVLALIAEARSLTPEELWPPPLLQPTDLEAAGLERGPLWGDTLRELEDAQLDGEITSQDEARGWLDQRARAAPSDADPASPLD
jgi:tRNA nucleotidyltransferase/poly(A) polymerase